MNVKLIFSVALFALCISGTSAQAVANQQKKDKKKKKGTTTAVQPATPSPKKNPEKEAYDKAVKEAKMQQGVFTTHLTKEGKLYLEVSKSAIDGREFLITNRIASTSNPKDYVAGQMIDDPILVRFEILKDKLYMYEVQNNNECRKGDEMQPAFERNFNDAVYRVFPKVALHNDNILVDVTGLFGSPDALLNPLAKPSNPLSKPLGGKFDAAGSHISSVKSFPENIEIKSYMAFTNETRPYAITTHRSLVRLPKEPMKVRIQDKRFGYFSSTRNVFTTEKDGMDKYSFIHRWRLEPKEEDMDKYLAGELVEPKKQIVYYVDNAFPEKWKSSIIQGINDWNIAFEKAGFKNAIVGKPYPTDDPNFDPDDMRYSCFKYAATTIPNAMGPSYVDPRSGEILVGDVIWYHNVISLVHNWRFSQTAAVDPRVRKEVFADDLMQECIRYVAAHEIGHTVGLMHNMGASSTIPVDSLRSATFTQKYGTTPSIMDYTRNNYVAQPGDLEKGVKMTPPVMGVFDEFTIKWGYTYIPTDKEEKPILEKLISEYKVYPTYRFGAQQYPGTIDPRDLGEDLGDDIYKANELGFKNLKLIIRNLEEWSAKETDDYKFMANNYKEIVSQYSRMVGHIMTHIGGCRLNENKQGDGLAARDYLSKKEVNRAAKWLIKEGRTYGDWLTPSYVTTKLGMFPGSNDRIASGIMGALFNGAALNRIHEGEIIGQRGCYKLRDYVSDVVAELYVPTKNGVALKNNDRLMQSIFVDLAIGTSGLVNQSAGGAKKLSDMDIAFNEFNESSRSYDSLTHSFNANGEAVSFFRLTAGEMSVSNRVLSPIMLNNLKVVLNIYKNAVNSANPQDKDFYNYMIKKIDNVLNNK